MPPARSPKNPRPNKAEIVPARTSRELVSLGQVGLPAAITTAGPKASRRFIQFFIAEISNDNTRAAYTRAVWQFFDWCEEHGLELEQIEPAHVAMYFKLKEQTASKQTVKQHLAGVGLPPSWRHGLC